jgi:hypothetical protein
MKLVVPSHCKNKPPARTGLSWRPSFISKIAICPRWFQPFQIDDLQAGFVRRCQIKAGNPGLIDFDVLKPTGEFPRYPVTFSFIKGLIR